MTARRTAIHIALLTCTALGIGAIAAAPAQAKDTIPSGAPPSPLLNGVKPFTQKLIIYEEFGLRPIAETFSNSSVHMPPPVDCDTSPNASTVVVYNRASADIVDGSALDAQNRL